MLLGKECGLGSPKRGLFLLHSMLRVADCVVMSEKSLSTRLFGWVLWRINPFRVLKNVLKRLLNVVRLFRFHGSYFLSKSCIHLKPLMAFLVKKKKERKKVLCNTNGIRYVFLYNYI